MKALSSLVLPAFSALCGLAPGWFAAGWFAQPGDSSGIANPPTAAQPLRPSSTMEEFESDVSGETIRDFRLGLKSVAECRQLIESLSAVPRKENPLFSVALRDYALRRWLELDAEDALSYAESTAGASYQSTLAGDLFRIWIGVNKESALNAYAQASPTTVAAARRDIFLKLAETDPLRAVEEMENPRWNSAKPQWDQAAAEVYGLWAKTDPLAAAERVLKRSVQDQGDLAAAAVANAWAQRAPEAAWAFFEHAGGDRGFPRDVVEAIMPQLLNRDPSAVTRVKESQLPGIAKNWTDADPEGAAAFAQGRPAGDPLRRELLAHAARSLATAEPERALQLYQDSGGGSLHDWENSGLLREAFASLAARDETRASSRMLELPRDQRIAAMSGIMTHGFALNVDTAASLCREWLGDPSTAELVIPALNVALSWGHGGGIHDLGPILQQLPEIEQGMGSYLLQGWARSDPETAAQYIAGKVSLNPDISSLDESAVAEICFSRPDFASNWVMQMPAGKFQQQTAEVLAKNWYRFDPEGATVWVDSLPDGATREAALKGFKQ